MTQTSGLIGKTAGSTPAGRGQSHGVVVPILDVFRLDRTEVLPVRWSALALSCFILLLSGCPSNTPGGRYCYGDGMCVEPDGNLVAADGRPANGGDELPGDVTAGDGDNEPGDAGPPPPDCRCTISATDTDGDCIPDDAEIGKCCARVGSGPCTSFNTTQGNCQALTGCQWNDSAPANLKCSANSDPAKWDTDGDGVGDGCEDKNRDGVRASNEMDPNNPDTDGDGIPDGLEDANKNGRFEPGETNALRPDTDMDGIPDGVEDRDHDGVVDPWVDTNGNGCWDPGEPGESNPRKADSDNDGLVDNSEDKNKNGVCDLGETCAFIADTDCDRLPDGKEDLNHNGVVNSGETDPLNPDTDGDGIKDGIEDANLNGAWDLGLETSALKVDTDGDGIWDGTLDLDNDGDCTEAGEHCGEDRNNNGIVDRFVDANGNGCWDEGEAAGESDPRLVDTDGDRLNDGLEDNDRDGQCGTRMALDPNGSGQIVRVFSETCAFLLDTDCDGLRDGIEDANRNGQHDVGETDPRYRDSDFDGLSDGCPVGADPKTCEDKNNNGQVDDCDALLPLSERLATCDTNPTNGDTDGDGLSDGCEVFFDPPSCTTAPDCSTDPLSEDTDGDGYADGEEDTNHNCTFEAGLGETDPRVFNPPPLPGTLERVQYNVCATQNLKELRYAESSRQTHDYKLALEVELDNASPTPSQKTYTIKAFGKDLNGGGLQETDAEDALFGHTFQSPRDVWDPAFNQLVSRDVYGFILVASPPGAETLDDALDSIRNQIATAVTKNANDRLVEVGALTSRPAHDDLPNFRINRNQRQMRLRVQGPAPFVSKFETWRMRNDILRTLFALYYPQELATGTACPVGNECATDQLCVAGQCHAGVPTGVPEADVMPISCPSANCHSDFSLYIEGVQRLDRGTTLGADGRLALSLTGGQPTFLFVVGVTPDESAAPGVPFRLHEDQLTRLEDLTGGSAIARFAAEISKACEKKPQQLARADMLWVVDDSRSMQQMIGRMQKAADAAKWSLTANSGIVDFRVAMTTSNPSVDFATQCQDYCGTACTAPGAVADAGKPRGDCEINCVSQTLGCLKICPTGCYTGCVGDVCACTAACPGNPADDTAPYCPNATPCINPAAIDSMMLSNAGYTSYTTESYPSTSPSTHQGTPGGGGNFYWEDSTYLDCKSDATVSGTQRQTQYLNSCAAVSGFSSFFGAGASRLQLLGNAGFLGSQSGAACTTAPMDLLYDPAASSPPSACSTSPSRYCDRLTADCADGPTVLASQMCDLIRAMGGLPCNLGSTSAPAMTNGFRPHSSSELGSRTARRLISKMLPALPRDYAGALPMKTHLRLNCAANADSGLVCPSASDAECAPYERCQSGVCRRTGNCPALGCDPTQAAVDGQSGVTTCDTGTPCWPGEYCDSTGRCKRDCTPVPLVTVFLSDEEDFYFKDECMLGTGYTTASSTWEREARRAADLSALAKTCYWIDGDPTTAEPCTLDYCSTDPNGIKPAGWTARFRTDWPHVGADTYNPDRTGWVDGGETTVKWRPAAAPECSATWADRDSTCLGDPCNANFSDQAACVQWGSRCSWVNNSRCMSTCAAYTYPAAPASGCDAACKRDFYAAQKTACEVDSACVWDQSRVSGANLTASGQREACVNKYPPNDCQACKRLRRQVESIEGGDGLVGLGVVGPAYAITRQKGFQGYATFDPTNGSVTRQDDCLGGTVTWGRGDGQALRDLAIGTLGRVQDVCTNSADNYRPFLQLLISDIAALSAPYRLLGAPIAATIKVGIARPLGTSPQTYDYFEVPRSQTSGFLYNATTNSIAFKSDPVDGVCGGGSCSANGVIEASEAEYARTAPHVPRENDQIFVSYRLWLPVPCKGECGAAARCQEHPTDVLCNADSQCVWDGAAVLPKTKCDALPEFAGEVCARVYCPDPPPPPTACPSGLDSECPALGQKCVSHECVFGCIPGEVIDLCVCGNCGPCETCNLAQGRCELSTTDKCVCDPREAQCGREQLRDPCLAVTIGGAQPCIWDEISSRCILGNRCMPTDPAACPPGFSCDESCICVPQNGCDAGFNNDGTVKDCGQAMACCNIWAADSTTCQVIGSSQATCDGTLGCTFNSTLNTCEPGAPPCCLAGEEAQCFTDPETGDSRILCIAERFCDCTPACNPVTEYCCDTCFNDGGTLCDCRLVPP
jgi:hypothetical protein